MSRHYHGLFQSKGGDMGGSSANISSRIKFSFPGFSSIVYSQDSLL